MPPQPHGSWGPAEGGWPHGAAGSRPRCPAAKQPPWHPAPSCSHRQLQMFLIILTATSRPRRAARIQGILLVLVGLFLRPGPRKGRVCPCLPQHASLAQTCPTEGVWLQLSCLQEQTRAGSWAKRGLCCFILAAPCAPQGHGAGGGHGGEFTAPRVPDVLGAPLGWGCRSPG